MRQILTRGVVKMRKIKVDCFWQSPCNNGFKVNCFDSQCESNNDDNIVRDDYKLGIFGIFWILVNLPNRTAENATA